MESSFQPLVSIIVPLYNQEKYIGACLRSVCRQTYKNLEIIVINDGSTDSSPKMAHNWAEKDERISVIDKQNQGVSLARRDGLLAANGDYVTFLDSDDTLKRYSIEIMVECALSTDVDLVQCSYDKQIGFIKRRKADRNYMFPYNQLISQPELFERYYVGFFSNKVFPILMWGKLYRKSVLAKAFQNTELFSSEVNLMGEDLYFNMKLFPYLGSMYRIDKSVYNYRYGGGTYGFNKNFPQLFILSDKRLHLLDEYSYTEGYQPLFEEYVACLYYHASQMIHYKKCRKDDVIDFLKHEINNRELMPRLVDFYSQNGSNSEAVKLLCSKDYEAMFDYAMKDAKRMFCSYKYRLFEFIVKLFTRFS